MSNERPMFGVTPPEPPKEKKDARPSVGAVWERMSKDNSIKYMTINLKLTKQLLQELLASAEEVVNLNLVAFQNKYKDDAKSPDFKIYQEVEQK